VAAVVPVAAAAGKEEAVAGSPLGAEPGWAAVRVAAWAEAAAVEEKVVAVAVCAEQEVVEEKVVAVAARLPAAEPEWAAARAGAWADEAVVAALLL